MSQWNAVNLSNQSGQNLLERGETWKHADFHEGSSVNQDENLTVGIDTDLGSQERVLYRPIYLNNVYAGVQVDGSFGLFAVLLIFVGV